MKYAAGGVRGKFGEALIVEVPLPPGMVSLTLKDSNGKPAAGVAWQLTLPDGTVRSGKSTEGGRISVDGVPAGDCKLVLPDFDKDGAPAAPAADAGYAQPAVGGDQLQA